MKPEILEKLTQVTNSLPREAIAPLTPIEIGGIQQIITALESKDFEDLIDQGKLTVAMIRPQANESALAGTDRSAAQQILDEIKKNQQVVYEFSCIFSRNMCENFYTGAPMLNQQAIRAVRNPSINRWEEFVQLMTSGPSTVLILYTQDGTAIPRWREQVGNRDNDKSDPIHSIRGKFGLPDNYNNLVHGSDSIESVKREIQFFRNYLATIVTMRS